jgi:hypothetical protein
MLLKDIAIKGEQLKPFLLNSRTRKRCLLSPFPFSIVVEFLASTIRQEQEIIET